MQRYLILKHFFDENKPRQLIIIAKSNEEAERVLEELNNPIHHAHYYEKEKTI